MKHYIKPHHIQKASIAFVAFVLSLPVAAVIGLWPSAASAANIGVSYSPSSQAISQNGTVAMAINVNAGAEAVVTAQVKVTYDSSKLQFVSISYAGTPLNESSPSEASGPGFYTLSRYKVATPHPSGTFRLATVTFKALVSSGSTNVGYDAANSSIYTEADTTNSSLTSLAGATYSFQQPPDTTNPAVNVTAPSQGSTVSGSINFSANASDDRGVTKVDFLVDGAVKASDTTAPYTTSIDTKTLSDGSHAFMAKAYDAAGNSSYATVTVTVKNNASTPAPSTGGTTTKPSGSTTTKPNSTPTTSSPSSSTSTTPSTQQSTTTSTPTATSTDGTTVENTQYQVTPLPNNTAAPAKKTSSTAQAVLKVGAVLALVAAAVGGYFVYRMVTLRHKTLAQQVAAVPTSVYPGVAAPAPTPFQPQQPAAQPTTPQGHTAPDPTVVHPTQPPTNQQ